MKIQKSVAIIGSGPAALMAADIVSQTQAKVSLFEKRKGAGRKLLIAGSSGLNISNSLPVPEFVRNYTGPKDLWQKLLTHFSPDDWIRFIENLGIETFEGTSKRYFVKDMKASKLLRVWIDRLIQRDVQLYFDHELETFNFNNHTKKWALGFSNKSSLEFDSVCLCLGGGSYEPSEKPLKWPEMLKGKQISFENFLPSNVGYQVHWNEDFLKETEGKPLKNIKLSSSRGSRMGDLVITKYGLEGTPVYFVGEEGKLTLDLKPDLTINQIIKKCQAVKENLSPLRRVKKQISLCPAAVALLFHHSPKSTLQDLHLLAQYIKSFPIQFQKSQSLEESISSSGGVSLHELNQDFMLNKCPGVFAAGEMLDWDAPTGGFLIQACVSQGFAAGQGIVRFLDL